MKKTILSLAVLVGVVAGAAALPPQSLLLQRDQRGNPINPPIYSVARVTSTSETLVCSGRCVLGALIMGTGPQTSAVTIRDTQSADGAGSNIVVGPYRFEVLNTSPGNNPVQFPLLFSNGISVKLNAASNGEIVSVEYLQVN